MRDIKLFGITLTPPMEAVLKAYWPGPTSFIFSVKESAYPFLHRGTNQIALRVPYNTELRACLEHVGPLVATSVNPTGQPAAKSISEAISYFGDQVDAYIDGGIRVASPSKLFRVDSDGTLSLIRG